MMVYCLCQEAWAFMAQVVVHLPCNQRSLVQPCSTPAFPSQFAGNSFIKSLYPHLHYYYPSVKMPGLLWHRWQSSAPLKSLHNHKVTPLSMVCSWPTTRKCRLLILIPQLVHWKLCSSKWLLTNKTDCQIVGASVQPPVISVCGSTKDESALPRVQVNGEWERERVTVQCA